MGVNNRHLGSFVTDVQTSFDLAPLLLSRAARNYFSDKFAEKPISAPPSTTPSRVSEGPATSFADAAGGSPVHYNIQARIDRLAVEFRPVPDGGFSDVYLIGPAEEIR